MRQGEYESASVILKCALRWHQMPCVRESNLIDEGYSWDRVNILGHLSTFKAFTKLKLQQARIERNLDTLKTVSTDAK